MNDDLTLLRTFARTDSEEAFAALVERHINLVYSVALRSVRDTHLAQEITQAVFIILARKADSLGDKTILSGWLCRTARYASANALKIQMRRQLREQEAFMQSQLDSGTGFQPVDEAESETWNQIAPLLDGAMEKLGQKDYDALVLRFFENKTFAEVGITLGASEDAAKMRVNRALEKLRKFFTKRGVSSTTAIIAGTISANSVQAAPVALAKSVTAVAIAKGAAASGSTLTLIKGALKIMAWSKAKTAIVAGTLVVLAAGTTTVTVKEIQKNKLDNAWRVRVYNSQLLEQASPQVRILPSKFPPGGIGSIDGAWMGIGQSVATIIEDAYLPGPYRTTFSTELPTGNYDFIAKLSKGSKAQDVSIALQSKIKERFGLVGHLEMQSADILLLVVKNPNASGLKIHDPQIIRSYYSTELGKISLVNRPLHELTDYLAGDFPIPIVNGTGIESNVDATLNWKKKDWEHPNLDGLKQALHDQLGLELVSTNMPIEMLVVEKVK